VALGVLEDESRVRLAKRIPEAVVLLVWAAFALSIKAGVLDNLQPAYYLASAFACGLLVLKACDPLASLSLFFSRPAMRWLGRYSYSLFLVHYTVVHLWAATVTQWLGTRDAMRFAIVFVSGTILISLAAARALYAVTERWYFAARQRPRG
jgi:peptidoglycan/LPS O-acetylase OafA/YrhL